MEKRKYIDIPGAVFLLGAGATALVLFLAYRAALLAAAGALQPDKERK